MATARSGSDTYDSWPLTRMLSVAGRLVTEAHQRHLTRAGLTPAGHMALELLASRSLSQVELADLAQVEQQTMSRTVERLERAGLVARVRDDADRRRLLVKRTPAGAAAYKKAARASEAMLGELAGSARDANALRRELASVLAVLQASRSGEPAGTRRTAPEATPASSTSRAASTSRRAAPGRAPARPRPARPVTRTGGAGRAR